ncbi:hypothetical protein CFC21_014169 [Triticum aestivum]|nr:hypothetical protein CFC21_014169 [Triticum aestivum]
MAVFRNNVAVAVWLGALMLMATLSASEGNPAFIGCFEVHQNCFPDDCQKRCEDDLGKDTLSECERDHGVLQPYPGLQCCCYRKDGTRK